MSEASAPPVSLYRALLTSIAQVEVAPGASLAHPRDNT
jgi:hypothetical protein